MAWIVNSEVRGSFVVTQILGICPQRQKRKKEKKELRFLVWADFTTLSSLLQKSFHSGLEPNGKYASS